MLKTARALGVAVATAAATCTLVVPAQALDLDEIPILGPLFANELPLPGFGDVVVDDAREQLFISGGPESQGIVVTDFTGHVKQTIEGQQGATGLVLSEDGSTVYAALSAGDAISAINTETLSETARYGTNAQTCPTHLARTGANVWFGYGCGASWQGKIGKLDTAAQPPAVQHDMQGNVPYQQAPQLAGGTGDAGPLVAGQPDVSLSHLQSYGSSGGTLTAGAGGDAAGSNLTDIAVSPDGRTLFTAAGSRDAVDAFGTADLAQAGAYASGPHPVAVAPSLDGGFLATGTASSTEDQVRIYQVGGSEPVKAVDVRGDDIAPRGLAWSAENERLFMITLNAEGVPTLECVKHPTQDLWPLF
jgi:DNA-binding beta-propeller fold protein YncE